MSESQIVEATTNDLLDIAVRGEASEWKIAVWPGLVEVLASDAAVVQTTKAVVLWQPLMSVTANDHSLIVETSRNVFRLAPGHRTFVIREAS
jgi:hypothetical protein